MKSLLGSQSVGSTKPTCGISLKDQAEQINQGLRGHYAYYGIAGNVGSLLGVYRHVERYWREMLSSRSQKGKVCWKVFLAITRKYPLQRPKLGYPRKAGHLVASTS
jgi:RNA-directed DNA polymerase